MLEALTKLVPSSLTTDYAVVASVAVGSVLLNVWHGHRAASFRKRAEMPYPFMYATEEHCKKNKSAYEYNCRQRAHGNYLENWPVFLVLFSLSSFVAPRISAAFGSVWLVGRVLYAIGYAQEPKKRMIGSLVQYCGLLPIFGINVLTIIKAFQH